MKRFTNTKPAAYDPAARDFPRIKKIELDEMQKKTIFKQKKVRKGNFRGEI